MKKRFMAALLCLCLLTGMFTAAYAISLDDDLIIDGGAPIIMPSSGSGSVVADTIESTTGDGYDEFDTENDPAYSKGVDIYAQAIDTAVTNAGTVYKVEIVWGDMAFAWGATEEITKTWNPGDHSYSDDADERVKKWYLLDDAALTKLEYNDGTYDSILTGTAQNYVLMFNHSNAAVNANVKMSEVNAPNAESGTADDNITATLTPDNDFGTTAVQNTENGGYDYALSYDTVNGVIYSKDNGTAAAAYVELSGEPTADALNDTTATTVARITVTLTLPASDVDEGASEG